MPRPHSATLLAATLLGLTVGCDSAGGQDRSPITVDLEVCLDGVLPDRNAPVYGQIDNDPAWSPDGRRLAYLRLGRGREDRMFQLWMLDLQTDERRMLRDGVRQVTWFPSGDSLLVSLDGHFHVLDLGGNVVRALPAGGYFPDVSADGQHLAWDDGWNIWMMSLAIGESWMIGKNVDLGAWRAGSGSPDGTRYAHLRYVDAPRGNTSVFTMAADGSNPERITTEPVDHRTPQWSPDSRYIAFPSMGCPWQTDILAHDFETGRRIRLTREGGVDVSWSPDSQQIAYVKYNPLLNPEEHRDEGQGYVHIRGIYTGESRQVTFPAE